MKCYLLEGKDESGSHAQSMHRVDTRNNETAQRELYTPLRSLVDLWEWPGTTQGSGEGFLIDPKRLY